jgi:glycosyltransferase involved in cell wall biosynthesis
VRVAFDTRPLVDRGGVGRYSRCLLQALRSTAEPGAEIVETHRPRSADVFHSPWIDGAPLHSPCPTVVTLHDLAGTKRRSEHLRTSVRPRLRQLAVQRAASVITPTHALAEDALACFALERDALVVIPAAPDPAMYPRSPAEIASVRERFALPERYLLWVGALEHPDPARNLAELAATPRTMPLVLAGATRPWAHELPNVILTGHVSDEHLAALYSGAHALVTPSQEEGFGLSAVEALACGTPVVACEVRTLRESCDGRATFVRAGDFRALIAAAEGARRPTPPPPSWTWEDAAQATWRVYEAAARKPEGSRPAIRSLRRRTPAPGASLARARRAQRQI